MKSPGLAAMLSIFPGLGQLYNGQIAKGLAMMFVVLMGVPLAMWGVGLIIIPVVWIWSMVDAYRVAEKLSRRPAYVHACSGCGHSLTGVAPEVVHCPQCGRPMVESPQPGPAQVIH